MSLYLLLQNLRQVFCSDLLMMRRKIARFINLPRAIHQHQRLCLGSWWPAAKSNRAEGMYDPVEDYFQLRFNFLPDVAQSRKYRFIRV